MPPVFILSIYWLVVDRRTPPNRPGRDNSVTVLPWNKRLTPGLHLSFKHVWARLPSHLRAISLYGYGSECAPLVIEYLGDVLCE